MILYVTNSYYNKTTCLNLFHVCDRIQSVLVHTRSSYNSGILNIPPLLDIALDAFQILGTALAITKQSFLLRRTLYLGN